MSTTCTLCSVRYAMAHPVPDVTTGLLQWMCLECAAQHSKPRRFPEGTQRTERPVAPHSDFADHERLSLGREVELAQGKAALLEMMLRRMVEAFPELRYGLTTAPQQQVLRDVRAVLEECK